MKIIYPNGHGGMAIIHPTQEALSSMTIHEIARKDVPTGIPYKVVNDGEIPTDRTFRDAWEIDASLTMDGYGA